MIVGEVVRVRYEITEELPSSAIFANYVARDRLHNTQVCLRFVKKPFSDEPEFVHVLCQVVEQTMQLDHPGIAKLYGIEEHDGKPFVICEFIRGSTLAERIRRLAPFSPSVACEIGIAIADALSYASERGIIHGDLCADHVIATLEGRTAVIDFGLWRCYGASQTAGAVVLSRMAPYLAPEVIEGGMPSQSSDVYALGVILFELLTGNFPFRGQTPAAILARHLSQPPPSVRAINPAIPPVLDAIVNKALAKNVVERYESSSQLLRDLRQLLDALRFGKKLTWPLEPEEGEEARTVKTYAEKKEEQKRAQVVFSNVPKTSTKPESYPVAIRTTRLSEPDDVPFWLRAIVFAAAGAFVMFVIGWIIFNLTQRPIVEAPSLLGMPISQAKEQTKRLNLDVAELGSEYNERYPQPGTVIYQYPAAKTPMREGGIIQVRLSLGSRMVEVPDLRGLTVTEAKTRLEKIGLELDPITHQTPSRTISEGLIVSTDPAPHERVERGTEITVTVSSGEKKAERRRDVSELIENKFSLSFRVQESDEPVLVRVEMTDARGVEEVIFEEQRPGGSEIVLKDIPGYGKEATFRIYFNGFLDQTVRRRGEKTE